ncbi:hypothetical protein VTL71DRAFT_7468 [Oculimacula yallundae]|uniref:Uncharacterized protein n=1 Tax=Oculimacula yallundae TaxID=86028 RepID=A0ABR4BU73_9HELO
MADIQLQLDQSDSEPPSLSDKSSDAASDQPSISSTSTSPPPAPHNIDRWNRHITLQEFGAGLQDAARALIPNDRTSRYERVTVLVLSWLDEDPQLPVSLEIAPLVHVFKKVYNYDVEEWQIPTKNSHWAVNRKIMSFVEPAEDDRQHLKIVYYAGHGRITKTKLLEWTSWRDNPRLHSQTRIQPVQWSSIQVLLEQAESDVLILLDCCAAGTANAGGGSGVTELIAACSYSGTANGVGRYSFTNALITELYELSQRPSFSTGELYRNVFLHVQCHSEHGRDRPAPVHLPLTKQSNFPRSIQLSVHTKAQPDARPSGDDLNNFSNDSSCNGLEHVPGQELTSKPSEYLPVMTPTRLSEDFVPRILFSVRLKESFKPNELSTEMLTEWFRMIPLAGIEDVKIEAGFDSFSSVVIVSVPIAMSAYIPMHPAVCCLGPITSRNMFLQPNPLIPTPAVAIIDPVGSGNVPSTLRRGRLGHTTGSIKKRKSRPLTSTWAKIRRAKSKPREDLTSMPFVGAIGKEITSPRIEDGVDKCVVDLLPQHTFYPEKSTLNKTWQPPPAAMAPISVFLHVGDVDQDKTMQNVLENASKEKSALPVLGLESGGRFVRGWQKKVNSEEGSCWSNSSTSTAYNSSKVPNGLKPKGYTSTSKSSTRYDPLAPNLRAGSSGNTLPRWPLGCTSNSTLVPQQSQNLVLVPAPQRALSSGPSQMSAAQKAFIFAMTPGHNQSAGLRLAWSWYLNFLYARIREAWVPLFRPVLKDINLALYSPLESDLALAMRFLTSVTIELKRSELALIDIVDTLYNQDILKFTDDEHSHANRLVFAAIGWITLLYSPNIHGSQKCFQINEPRVKDPGQSACSESNMVHQGSINRQNKRQKMTRNYQQDMDYADQPLVTLLRRFGKILPEPVVRSREFEIAGSSYAECIEVPMISFSTLRTCSSIRILWVDSLDQHLELDQRDQTLKLFRFPALCLIMGAPEESGCLSQLFLDARSDFVDDGHAREYFQEMLLSYRLIFGMDMSSYKGFQLFERTSCPDSRSPIDPLLNIICGRSWRDKEVAQIFDECDIDEPRMRYNARTDFPFLGTRLIQLQEYSRSSYPNTLAGLWRDRRDNQRWWTLWVAMFVLGLTIVFGLIQTIAAFLQLYYSYHLLMKPK